MEYCCVVCGQPFGCCECDPGPAPEPVPSWEVVKVYGESSPGAEWEPFAAVSEPGFTGLPATAVFWRKRSMPGEE